MLFCVTQIDGMGHSLLALRDGHCGPYLTAETLRVGDIKKHSGLASHDGGLSVLRVSFKKDLITFCFSITADYSIILVLGVHFSD